MHRVWYEEKNGMFSGSIFLEEDTTEDQEKALKVIFPGFDIKVTHSVSTRMMSCFTEGDNNE